MAASGFCHDDNGNLTADAGKAYRYDVENRLVEVRTRVGTTCPPAYTGTLLSSLSYDPLGRLYAITGVTDNARLLYDGDALVAEYDAGGTLLRRWVHGDGVDEPLIWYEGPTLATRRSLQADQIGSVVSVADASGAGIAISAYDPWGNATGGVAGQRFGYTGQIWLADVGAYHYKARVYSAALGRFLQTDPVGYADQVNLYAYVGGDPVNGRDPTGLSSFDEDQEKEDIVVTASAGGATYAGGGSQGWGGGGATGAWSTAKPRTTLTQNEFDPVVAVVIEKLEARDPPPTKEELQALLPSGMSLADFGKLAGFATSQNDSRSASIIPSSETIDKMQKSGISLQAIIRFQKFYAYIAIKNKGGVVNYSAIHRSFLLAIIARNYAPRRK